MGLREQGCIGMMIQKTDKSKSDFNHQHDKCLGFVMNIYYFCANYSCVHNKKICCVEVCLNVKIKLLMKKSVGC